MNVIYINTHDSGRMLSPYGYDIPTENLKEFSKDAVVFTQAYCAAPTCSPSRAAMLTGMYPHQNGMLGLAQRGFGLDDYEKHMAHYFSRNGYTTALCGIQHETGWYLHLDGIEKLGYQHVLTTDSSIYQKEELHHWDRENAKEVVNWINHVDQTKPFFLSFGMHSTHRPYPVEIHESIDARYVIPPFPMNNNETMRHDHAQYMTSAYYMDQNFNMVIEALKKNHLYDNTIILFTTDHGIALPFNKCNLFDTGIGVGLIMRIPNGKVNGQIVDSLVSQVDVFPTLCDLLGMEKPDYLEGASFASVFDGQNKEIQEEIFAEINFHTSYEPARCVRTNRYKYIRYFDLSFLNINLSNIDSSSPKDFYLDHDISSQTKFSEALYDLYYDSSERNNLIHDSRYEEIKMMMIQKLEDFQKKTKDPVLLGELEVKPNYKINKKQCIDASSTLISDYDERGGFKDV